MTEGNGMRRKVDTRVTKKNLSKYETRMIKWSLPGEGSVAEGRRTKALKCARHNTVLHYHMPRMQSHIPFCCHVAVSISKASKYSTYNQNKLPPREVWYFSEINPFLQMVEKLSLTKHETDFFFF